MSHFLYQHNTYSDSRHENTGRSTILYSLVACFSVPLFAIEIVTVGVCATSEPTDPRANLRSARFRGRETQCDKKERDLSIRAKDNILLKAFSLQIASKGSTVFCIF